MVHYNGTLLPDQLSPAVVPVVILIVITTSHTNWKKTGRCGSTSLPSIHPGEIQESKLFKSSAVQATNHSLVKFWLDLMFGTKIIKNDSN
jgi:hypothetical protein